LGAIEGGRCGGSAIAGRSGAASADGGFDDSGGVDVADDEIGFLKKVVAAFGVREDGVGSDLGTRCWSTVAGVAGGACAGQGGDDAGGKDDFTDNEIGVIGDQEVAGGVECDVEDGADLGGRRGCGIARVSGGASASDASEGSGRVGVIDACLVGNVEAAGVVGEDARRVGLREGEGEDVGSVGGADGTSEAGDAYCC